MYKIYTRKSSVPNFGYANKLLFIMRLTFFIVLATFMQVSATTFAQKISLKETNVPLEKVFKKISQQSGYDFLVFGNILKDAKPVTINAKDVELNTLLENIFANQNIAFKIKDKTIVLSKSKESLLEMIKSYFAETTIKGTVYDDKGSPLPGATVKVKDKSILVVTNAEGNFTITVPNDKSILVFSYIGYLNLELPAKPNMVINMKLQSNKLEETVVVGYGSTKRKDLTGSVSSINVDEVKDVPFSTFDQALSGKAAGVQVVQADGSPGGVAKIRIRGGTSLLGGNDPLYIIDGVQVQVQNNYLSAAADVVSPVERAGSDDPNSAISGAFARALNSLGSLNINDIATIDILKDASATAIYGSRAANSTLR